VKSEESVKSVCKRREEVMKKNENGRSQSLVLMHVLLYGRSTYIAVRQFRCGERVSAQGTIMSVELRGGCVGLVSGLYQV